MHHGSQAYDVVSCFLQHLQAMSRVWGNGDHVQVVHPGSNIIVGREEVGFGNPRIPTHPGDPVLFLV